jgi:hypothetical protein
MRGTLTRKLFRLRRNDEWQEQGVVDRVAAPRAEAIEQFAAELRALRASAGSPSFRTMSGRSHAISHTTLHDAVQGHRLPSWPTTAEFVKACRADPADFRERWERANQIVRSSAPPPEPPALVPDAAEPSALSPEAAGSSAPGLGAAGASALVPEAAGPSALSPDASGASALIADAAGPSVLNSGTPGSSDLSPHAPGRPERADEAPAAAEAAPPAALPAVAVPASRRWTRHAVLVTALAGALIAGSVVVGVAASRGDNPPYRQASTTAARPLTAADCPVQQSNPPVASPPNTGDAGAFIGDITLPDCTHVARGSTSTKIWRFKNVGTVPWHGYVLHRIDLPQQRNQCQTITDVPIDDTEPGQMVDVKVMISAPMSAGFCFVRFKMEDASGRIAFPGNRPVNFQLIVD